VKGCLCDRRRKKAMGLRLIWTSILADDLFNTACSVFSTPDLNLFIILTSLVVSVLFSLLN
jgi:hypothetical protein